MSYDQSLGGLTVDKEDNITVQSRGKIQKKKKEKRKKRLRCCGVFLFSVFSLTRLLLLHVSNCGPNTLVILYFF
jgi:hypothetical protein